MSVPRPAATHSSNFPAKTPLKKRDQVVRDLRQHLATNADNEASKLLAELPPKLTADPEILFLKAIFYERRGMIEPALRAAEASFKSHPHEEAILLLARLHRVKGNTDDALSLLDEFDAKRPGDERCRLVRAGTLEEAGRAAEAAEVFAPLLDTLSDDKGVLPTYAAAEYAKILVQLKDYDNAIEQINRVIADPDTPPPILSGQNHLKAKAHDRQQQYDLAAAAAATANTHGKVGFDPDLYTEQVTALIGNWSRENMGTFPQSNCRSELPVFVAGMPRSGTSLIDQIIDAHPKAAGVGELNSIERFAAELSRAYNPDSPPHRRFGKFDTFRWTRVADEYVREVTELAPAGSERVVNKALGNNKLVGLLARLFPKTRIIHAIRDPRDVAVSCFMGGFNNRIHAWTTQIDWAAHAWKQSERMMTHWKQTLDIPILDVHYEKLVADPENEMPRIIEFLGLEWDDACRDFYKSKRTVRTLSYDQVNRPLYTSSSGRHENYARLIKGVDFPDYNPFT